MTNAILPPYVLYYLKGNDTQLPSHQHVNSLLIMKWGGEKGGGGLPCTHILEDVNIFSNFMFPHFKRTELLKSTLLFMTEEITESSLPDLGRKWENNEWQENSGKFLQETQSLAPCSLFLTSTCCLLFWAQGMRGKGLRLNVTLCQLLQKSVTD